MKPSVPYKHEGLWIYDFSSEPLTLRHMVRVPLYVARIKAGRFFRERDMGMW